MDADESSFQDEALSAGPRWRSAGSEPWHERQVREVAERLGVDPVLGLSEEEAERRLAEQGPNELVDRGGKGPGRIVWEQLSSVMVAVLLAAALVSAMLGDLRDALAIMAIVILNVLLGFRQEYRAEKAMAALKRMAVPAVRVRRDGRVLELSARSLVPGDMVVLEAGNMVPADGRVFAAHNLRVQEAALTGESEAVTKYTEPVEGEAVPVSDRRSMVHMGTVVTYGRGEVGVTATGMDTELGAVAAMIQTVGGEPTPLQRRLDQLGKGLALAALLLVAVIFTAGVVRGEGLELMFMTAVSMAVAAVPEGLPAVVTIALALGAQRMLRRHALIRKLPAVETLGSVTVICSDKTGTLTANRMSVAVLDVAGRRVSLDQPGKEYTDLPEGGGDQSISLTILLAGAALCNDAALAAEAPDEEGFFRTRGDPTEGALVSVAARAGLWKRELDGYLPRMGEVPFDSSRKRMTTLHHLPSSTAGLPESLGRALEAVRGAAAAGGLSFTKGAVDTLLEVSTHILTGADREELDDEGRERILRANDRLAAHGMRVLALGYRLVNRTVAEAWQESMIDEGAAGTLEDGLVFVGLMGLVDPARPEARTAVATCRAAGVRPLMITGDHPLTAAFIAEQLGISTEGGILTGRDLATLSPEELGRRVEEVSVFARVSPEHKLAIVRALQERGHIVAMTGDGVNDAPALKQADIGVAMGVTGTDVSKEAADMVLLDDDFATIVAAVEEGRVIYDNIRKFIRYILSSNSGELSVMLIAPFVGLPLPLLPLQILWINLVTDGLPALALSLEPPERDIMRRPPHPPSESIFGRGLGVHVLWVGLLMGLVSLGVGYAYRVAGHETWQTQVFTTLTLSQMGLALAVRSERDALFRVGFLSNKALVGSVLLTFGLQLGVVYLPFLQGVFHTHPLSAVDLLVALALSTVVFWAVEGQKWISHRRRSVG